MPHFPTDITLKDGFRIPQNRLPESIIWRIMSQP